jgi:uncharacterized protein (DUF1778 family)
VRSADGNLTPPVLRFLLIAARLQLYARNADEQVHRKVNMTNATEERGCITALVSTPIVEKLQEAADLTGATLNQFLVQAALEKAEDVIAREHTIRYSREDAAMLLSMLDKPSGPNEALTKAFELYKEKVENGSLRDGPDSST